MATDILVPTLGESVSEATVAQWLKKAGEAVKKDEPVVELDFEHHRSAVTGSCLDFHTQFGNDPLTGRTGCRASGRVAGSIVANAGSLPDDHASSGRLGLLIIASQISF